MLGPHYRLSSPCGTEALKMQQPVTVASRHRLLEKEGFRGAPLPYNVHELEPLSLSRSGPHCTSTSQAFFRSRNFSRFTTGSFRYLRLGAGVQKPTSWGNQHRDPDQNLRRKRRGVRLSKLIGVASVAILVGAQGGSSVEELSRGS